MATLGEKLQLTLNIKNNIKQALEDNNVSTTNKTFEDYPTLINDNLSKVHKLLLFSTSTAIPANLDNYNFRNNPLRITYPCKISQQSLSGDFTGSNNTSIAVADAFDESKTGAEQFTNLRTVLLYQASGSDYVSSPATFENGTILVHAASGTGTFSTNSYIAIESI